MATKRVTVTINDAPVELTLRRASVEDGLHRGQLMAKAYNEYTELEKTEPVSREVQIAGTILHPVCVSCVREPRAIRDMSIAEFMTLDDQEVSAWVAAAYELNPHWKIQPQTELTPADEKKTGMSSTGADQSTKPAEDLTPISLH